MPPRPMRETRASKEAAVVAAVTPNSKRKRQASPNASGVSDVPLKVVLPSYASLAKPTSPTETNGDPKGDQGAKRPRLSLTVREPLVDGALSRDTRDAVALIIARMGLRLPPALRHILALWLPPDFSQSDENTLGYILRQPSLTWEKLASHIASGGRKSLRGLAGPSVIPRLTETIIRKASLKANKWKELRDTRGLGVEFGSTRKGGFTPSFGPSYDSTQATGGHGFYSTLDGMHERARYREFTARVRRVGNHPDHGGYAGNDEISRPQPSANDVLEENAAMIGELQAWQQMRVKMGIAEATERENDIANALLASLTDLTSSVLPADMTPARMSRPGMAHELAKRVLPVSSPSIRGILDPRRPHALHDNTTLSVRPAQPMPVSTSTYAPPAVKMAPPPIPQYSAPPQHTLSAPRYPRTNALATGYPYSPTPNPTAPLSGFNGPTGVTNYRQSYGSTAGHGGAYSSGMR
ncbi:hypothetical protein IAU60_002234 [Kwoniella sp. DSM 27419]